jgi:hypothetical protein
MMNAHQHSPFEQKHEAVIRRFMQLFEGSSRGHGQFVESPARGDGKVKGDARTVPGSPNIEHYARHLYGSGPGLGIVPIREDGFCVFGAIDFDDRAVDHSQLERRVRALGLPLVVCRSKSGGAHLYHFSAPLPAAEMRLRLQRFRASLGMPDKTEIFPKQDDLDGSAIGNWINLPYFGALCR